MKAAAQQPFAEMTGRDVMALFDDPNSVAQNEYRVIYEFLADLFDDEDWSDPEIECGRPSDVALAALSQFAIQALTMRKRILVAIEDRS